MNESFPHYYADGYVVTNERMSGWPIVFYSGLYKKTKVLPYQWNEGFKKSKPVAIFITSQWRTEIHENDKLWYRCEVKYKYSAN